MGRKRVGRESLISFASRDVVLEGLRARMNGNGIYAFNTVDRCKSGEVFVTLKSNHMSERAT